MACIFSLYFVLIVLLSYRWFVCLRIHCAQGNTKRIWCDCESRIDPYCIYLFSIVYTPVWGYGLDGPCGRFNEPLSGHGRSLSCLSRLTPLYISYFHLMGSQMIILQVTLLIRHCTVDVRSFVAVPCAWDNLYEQMLELNQ